MSTLKINFERLRQEGLKDCFEALERAFYKFDIDFYLIGARARDAWIEHLYLRDRRITTDVDFAIYIRTHEQFQELSEYLCTVESFHREPNAPYRFRFGGANGLIVDLLPFGAIEQDGSVWLENPPTEISVYGMKEVTEQAEVITGAWKVISLPGLVVLKLIAFSENPGRQKDLRDIELILQHYHEIVPDIFWEPGYDDLLTGNIDPEPVAARILGRQIGTLLSSNTTLREGTLAALSEKLQRFNEEEINATYRNRDQNDSQVVLLKLFLECIVGIKDIHG